jgi:hypothetical protein
LQDGSVGLEELLDTGFLVDLRKGGRGGDAELIKMAMLLLLGLWGQLADVQIENSIEFVGGKGRIHAFDLVLPVVEHRNFVGKFFHDFHDDCLGLVYINGWSFFGLGSEFHLQNQGVGLSGHWSVGRKMHPATVTLSSLAAAMGTVSWARSVGRRDMSMSTVRAAPREDMLCRLYVIGFCGITTGISVTL